MLDALEELITATEAARRLQVTVAAVTNWATRGYRSETGEKVVLPVRGLNERGHKLYRFIDVALAERATREHAKRRYPAAVEA